MTQDTVWICDKCGIKARSWKEYKNMQWTKILYSTEESELYRYRFEDTLGTKHLCPDCYQRWFSTLWRKEDEESNHADQNRG